MLEAWGRKVQQGKTEMMEYKGFKDLKDLKDKKAMSGLKEYLALPERQGKAMLGQQERRGQSGLKEIPDCKDKMAIKVRQAMAWVLSFELRVDHDIMQDGFYKGEQNENWIDGTSTT